VRNSKGDRGASRRILISMNARRWSKLAGMTRASSARSCCSSVSGVQRLVKCTCAVHWKMACRFHSVRGPRLQFVDVADKSTASNNTWARTRLIRSRRALVSPRPASVAHSPGRCPPPPVSRATLSDLFVTRPRATPGVFLQWGLLG